MSIKYLSNLIILIIIIILMIFKVKIIDHLERSGNDFRKENYLMNMGTCNALWRIKTHVCVGTSLFPFCLLLPSFFHLSALTSLLLLSSPSLTPSRSYSYMYILPDSSPSSLFYFDKRLSCYLHGARVTGTTLFQPRCVRSCDLIVDSLTLFTEKA